MAQYLVSVLLVSNWKDAQRPAADGFPLRSLRRLLSFSTIGAKHSRGGGPRPNPSAQAVRSTLNFGVRFAILGRFSRLNRRGLGGGNRSALGLAERDDVLRAAREAPAR